jgi:hypothetical protein
MLTAVLGAMEAMHEEDQCARGCSFDRYGDRWAGCSRADHRHAKQRSRCSGVAGKQVGPSCKAGAKPEWSIQRRQPGSKQSSRITRKQIRACARKTVQVVVRVAATLAAFFCSFFLCGHASRSKWLYLPQEKRIDGAKFSSRWRPPITAAPHAAAAPAAKAAAKVNARITALSRAFAAASRDSDRTCATRRSASAAGRPVRADTSCTR